MDIFNQLVNSLEGAGYIVKVSPVPDDFNLGYKSYRYATVKGFNIVAGFCDKNEETYPDINGKIAADHERCFDKWSKCPLVLPLPQNGAQLDFLLQQLRYWGSDGGLQKSDNYETDSWVYSYPQE